VNDAVALRDAARGESNAHAFTREGGRGIVLRFAGFYAPDSVQTLTMAALARRRRMALIGRGDNYFASIHTDDAAAAVVASLEAPAGVYNVGDDNPLRFREYMAAMTAAVGAPPLRRIPGFMGPLVMGATWSYLRRSQRISSRRLRQTVGWRPRVTDAREGWRAIAAEWSGSTSA
jgi:nucleoside-diphosphate-sugar epimerase